MKKPKKNYWEERSRMSNIPKLRFPEFKGEWEEKKFSEIVYLENERDVCKKSDYITTENLNKDYAGVTFNTNSNEIVPGIKYLKDDILFGNIRPYLKKVWQADRNGCVNSDVLVFKIIKDNSKFINNIICSDLFLSHVMNGAKGTKMPRGDKNQMMDFIAKIPSLPEQQKIADFLSNVDSIITAETKILNTLQKRKKALMQKLFTQQLRFKSDDGTDFPEWEEKKVIDFAKVDTGANNTQDKVEDGPYPFYVRSPIIYRSNKYIFDFPEAVLTVGDGVGTGKVFHYVQGKFDCHQRVYVIHDFENVLGKYFYFYFSEKFYARVKPMSAKNSVDSVRREMITDMKIPIPCKAEQQKIADCLSSLDSLIQTQQKVVTTWQQRKKALLQQMFI